MSGIIDRNGMVNLHIEIFKAENLHIFLQLREIFEFSKFQVEISQNFDRRIMMFLRP